MNDETRNPAHLPDPIPGVGPLDWRTAGFVAVHRAEFPNGNPTAHRAVRWYMDEVLTQAPTMPARDVQIRPACMHPEADAGYIEMTPLYAESRGAVWCHEAECFRDVEG